LIARVKVLICFGLSFGAQIWITCCSSGIAAINFETCARNKSSFRTGEIRDHASYLVTLSTATQGAAKSLSAAFISVSIATWSQRVALPIDYCATYPPSNINVSPVMNDDDLSESYRVSEWGARCPIVDRNTSSGSYFRFRSSKRS
jgi:hypothetical protein